MTSARDEIFANIRRSLGVTGQEATRRMSVSERLDRAPKGIVPSRGQGNAGERLTIFKQQAEQVQATVEEVDSIADAPAAVARYLRERNLPASVRMGDDLRLKMAPWSDTALDVRYGASDGNDLNAVAHAFCAVAETGTLVMTSGPDNPTTLNFLPDNHIVILNARDVGPDMEEAWEKIRRAHGKGEMPRIVNFITGPSRSADIEQTVLLGAHGPRSLHIVVVKG